MKHMLCLKPSDSPTAVSAVLAAILRWRAAGCLQDIDSIGLHSGLYEPDLEKMSPEQQDQALQREQAALLTTLPVVPALPFVQEVSISSCRLTAQMSAQLRQVLPAQVQSVRFLFWGDPEPATAAQLLAGLPRSVSQVVIDCALSVEVLLAACRAVQRPIFLVLSWCTCPEVVDEVVCALRAERNNLVSIRMAPDS